MRSRTAVAAVYYTGLILTIAAVLLQLLPLAVPDGLAGRIGHNSEGLVLALLLSAWIQFARPRLTGTPREWPVTVAVAVLFAALAVFLLATDLPSRFRTLNETFLAAAVLVPYLQVRRPLRGRLALWLSLGVLAVVVLANRTAVVTDLAETLGVLILAPIGLDLVDRAILDPRARTSAPVRYGWYAFLVVAPIVLAVLQWRIGVGGLFGEATRYGVRITEAFICLLLVEVYFAVGLGRTGAPAQSAPAAFSAR
jgi:hypothetical protein